MSTIALFVEKEPDGDTAPTLFGTKQARLPKPVTDAISLQRAADRVIGIIRDE